MQLLGTVVNVAILLVGARALVDLWMAFRRLREETKHLRRFEHKVRGHSEPEAIVSVGQSIPEHHLLARRIRHLHELHGVGAEIEPAALAAIAVAKLDREARFARWSASSVVLFGLGGTLIGLSQAVIRAQSILNDILTGPQAIQAVLDTFSGLGTAFSTTLMGIVWAVVIGLGLGRLRRKQGEYLQQLEEVSLVRLFPCFRTSPALAMVEAATKLSALEAHLGKSLADIVGQLKTQGLALTKVVEDSVGDLVTETRGTLGQVVRETQERGLALTGTVDRSLNTLNEEIRTGLGALLERFERTQQVVQAMLGEPAAEAHTLAHHLDGLEQGVRAMHAAAQKMAEITPSIEEAIAGQVDRQSRDLHETMHAYVGKLAENLERQDTIIEVGLAKVGEGFPRFQEILLGQIKEQGRAIAGSLEEPFVRIASALKSQAQQIAALEAAAGKLESGASLLQSRGTLDMESAEALRIAVSDLAAQVRTISGDLAEFEKRLITVPPPAQQRPAPQSQAVSSTPADEPGLHSPESELPVTTTAGAARPTEITRPPSGNGSGAPPPIQLRSRDAAGFWDRILRRTK
jgi:biopolymer transport protein ExbB/TolQ